MAERWTSGLAAQLLDANEDKVAELAPALVERFGAEFGLPHVPVDLLWPGDIVELTRQFLVHVASDEIRRIRQPGGIFERMGVEAARGGLDLEVLAAAVRRSAGLMQAQTHRAVLADPEASDQEAVLELLQRVILGGEAVIEAARRGYEIAGLGSEGHEELARQLAAELIARGDRAPELARRLGWDPGGSVCAVVASVAEGGAVTGAVRGTAAYCTRANDVVVAVPLPPERLATSLRPVLAKSRCAVGPAVPLDDFCDSLALAQRVRDLGGKGEGGGARFVDDELLSLVCTAEPTATQALRRKYFAEIDELEPDARRVLLATLHEWLLHWGHRPAVAERLSVHPQTVSGRLNRLRDLLADDLEDPRVRAELLVLMTAEGAA